MDVGLASRLVMVVAVALQAVVVVHSIRRRPDPDRGFMLRVQAAAVVGWIVALVLQAND